MPWLECHRDRDLVRCLVAAGVVPQHRFMQCCLDSNQGCVLFLGRQFSLNCITMFRFRVNPSLLRKCVSRWMVDDPFTLAGAGSKRVLGPAISETLEAIDVLGTPGTLNAMDSPPATADSTGPRRNRHSRHAAQKLPREALPCAERLRRIEFRCQHRVRRRSRSTGPPLQASMQSAHAARSAAALNIAAQGSFVERYPCAERLRRVDLRCRHRVRQS